MYVRAYEYIISVVYFLLTSKRFPASLDYQSSNWSLYRTSGVLIFLKVRERFWTVLLLRVTRVTARYTSPPACHRPALSSSGGAASVADQSVCSVGARWALWRHTPRSRAVAATDLAWCWNTGHSSPRSQAGPCGAETGSSRTADWRCRTVWRTPRLCSCWTWPTSRCSRSPGRERDTAV